MPDIIRGNPPQYIPVKQTEVIKPNAYLNSTPPVHNKGYVNGTGRNTMTGASTGFAFGGPPGAFIGGAIGLGTDIWQAVYAKRAAEKANQESKEAAARASAQNANEARAARNWNSEQAQVRRLRMAGLSPGLAYGNMSPSTAQPASGEKQDVSKADTPKFDNESLLRALELLVKESQARTAAAAQQSTSELQGSQVDLNLIDSLYKGRQYEATISSILADKELTGTKKLEILQLLTGRQNLINAQSDAAAAAARQSNAAANVTEQTGVDLAKSQTASNNASASLNAQQEKVIKLTYDLDNAQWNSIQKFMKDNGFDEGLAPLVMKAINSIAEQSGATVRTVIDNLSKFPDIIKSFISGM